MRALPYARIAIFLAALIFPLATLGSGERTLANEQRTRASLPSPGEAGFAFPERFDAWFRDNFGARDRLIRWYHLLKFRALGESPIDAVIVGRDGWLFYSVPTDGMDIRNFSGHWPHDPSDVDVWLQREAARRDQYAKLGARYLIAIVPDKQSMYPGQVPFRYGPQAPGVMAELMARLEAHPRVPVLDLGPVLRRRSDGPLYYKGDTHWNGRGAFAAAEAIVDRLRPELPSIGPMREADYTVTPSPRDTGDLVTIMGLGLPAGDRAFAYARRTPGARLIQEDARHHVWEQPGSGLPTAVLFGDSFGVELAPILADSFSRLHYYLSSIGGPDPSLVARERPDVVILVTVERYLPHLGQ